MRKLSPTSSRRPTSSLSVTTGTSASYRGALGGGTAGGSSKATAAALGSNRPPVLMQFSAHHTVSVGHVGSSMILPKHCVELPIIEHHLQLKDRVSTGNPSQTNFISAEVYFQMYAAPIEHIYQLLTGGGGSSSGGGGGGISSSTAASSGTAKNRIIVLHSQGLYPNRHWKLGVSRILQDVLNVSYVSFQSTIQMIPFAVTAAVASEDASSSLPDVVLSVVLSTVDAQCMVYASGHMLEYTYQSCGYNSSATASTVGQVRQMQLEWVLQSTDETITPPSPLVVTICQSLIACPMALRRHAIHNLVVAGTVLVDGFATQLAQRLYEYLSRNEPDRKASKPNPSDASMTLTEEGAASTTTESPVAVTEAATFNDYTHVPINRNVLRPLAEHIAIVTIDDNRRTEVLPWLGTSVWANYWYQYEQENGRLVEQLQWLNL